MMSCFSVTMTGIGMPVRILGEVWAVLVSQPRRPILNVHIEDVQFLSAKDRAREVITKTVSDIRIQ
jgi:hypothetical protein